MIRFFVAGIPKAMSVGGAHIRTKTGAQFATRRNTDWATLVGHIGRQHAPPTPLAGAIVFTAKFYVPRPASAKKAGWPLKRPDIDNLVHKLSDHFNGVFWKDDSQVVHMNACKSFADDGRPGVEITVAEIAPGS